jgi:anti-anti-sigma factor
MFSATEPNVPHKRREVVIYCAHGQLLRGGEQLLLASLLPIVARHNVALDLEQVERMDAAGISALVKLYGAAHKAGRSFRVLKPSRNVKGLLHTVRLESFLLSHNVNHGSHSGPLTRPTAA